MNPNTKKLALPWILTALVLAAVAVLYWSQNSKKISQLNRSALTQAKKLWAEKGPKSYSMEINVTGVQPGTYIIKVHDGKAASVQLNGTTTPERTWQYWTIEGMFQVIDEELTSHEGNAASTSVYLAADFDIESGYPAHYLRQVFGENMTIQWNVKHFTTEK